MPCPTPNPGLMTIFAEALERTDPAERAAYLDRACGGDADLRRRVEALLAAHAGAGRFLEPDATGALDATAAGGRRRRPRARSLRTRPTGDRGDRGDAPTGREPVRRRRDWARSSPAGTRWSR